MVEIVLGFFHAQDGSRVGIWDGWKMINEPLTCSQLRPENSSLGRVAQLVEHRIENPSVGGSNPPLTTTME